MAPYFQEYGDLTEFWKAPKIKIELRILALLDSAKEEVMVMTGKACHINRSNVDELRNSAGIGDNEAQRLIDYRKEHGEFRTLDDIMNVPGFTPDTVEKIKRECDLD